MSWLNDKKKLIIKSGCHKLKLSLKKIIYKKKNVNQTFIQQ